MQFDARIEIAKQRAGLETRANGNTPDAAPTFLAPGNAQADLNAFPLTDAG